MKAPTLLALWLAPLFMARAAKKGKPPPKAKAVKPPPKPAKKQPVRPVAPAPPPAPKPKPVYSLPFDHPGKVTAPAGAPVPVFPVRGERVGTLNPRFGWISVASAKQYQLAWGTDGHLNRSHSQVVNQTATTLSDAETLKSGTLYYWRVRAGNESGWGPWSSIQEFGTSEEGVSQ